VVGAGSIPGDSSFYNFFLKKPSPQPALESIIFDRDGLAAIIP
jgi:hypothetical protein